MSLSRRYVDQKIQKGRVAEAKHAELRRMLTTHNIIAGHGRSERTVTISPTTFPYRAKNGPYRAKQTEKTGQKLKNRKFKKPYIKVVREASKWDSGRWEWLEIILELISLEFHGIWSHKT